MSEITVLFEDGSSRKLTGNTGDNLLEVLRSHNVAIDAPCSGNGACGKCRVCLKDGELDSFHSPQISDEDYENGWRLACCSHLTANDVSVLVPDIASAYQSRIRTADLSDEKELRVFETMQENMREAGLRLRHPYKSAVIHMSEPTLDDTMPDNERLIKAIKEELGFSHVQIYIYALERIAYAMRSNNFTVSIIYTEKERNGCAVYSVYGRSEPVKVCGVAIDIGTTTVSGVLMDLADGQILAKASAGNGQIRYGADVINRIVEQSKPGGRGKLKDAINQETLRPLIARLRKAAGVELGQIMRMTIAGNTTMNHLLLGVQANPLRTEPYIPTFFNCDPIPAGELIHWINPAAKVFIAPNIGSYVGGDITAGTMASMIWNKDEMSLFIDLGTNGELVFGNRDFMMSCACSAGPAFEGGDISCGMRATDGAIEAVKIDKETMEPTLTIIGKKGQKPVGICGSGIIDIIAELYRTAIIDSKGKFVREGSRVERDAHGMGCYVIADRNASMTGRKITITEVDIESFIRAKGAIYSAISTMLGTLDMTPEVIDQIYVAGGIGSGINIENAIRIGMLPDVEREKFHYIGNSSLSGAYAMAISNPAWEKVQEIAANMTYLELSTYPGYMDHFVAACFIPHTDAHLFPSSVQEA